MHWHPLELMGQWEQMHDHVLEGVGEAYELVAFGGLESDI
jgi:hypothetical protein